MYEMWEGESMNLVREALDKIANITNVHPIDADRRDRIHSLANHAIRDLDAALATVQAVPKDTAERIKKAVHTDVAPTNWNEAVLLLLQDHDTWEKHSLTQLVTENAQLKASLAAAVEAQRKVDVEAVESETQAAIKAEKRWRIKHAEEEIDGVRKSQRVENSLTTLGIQIITTIRAQEQAGGMHE